MATDPKDIRVANLEQYDHRNLESEDEAPPSDQVSKPVKAPSETPAAPAKPTHPSALIRRALELGASQDYIDKLTTDQLSEAVYLADRQVEKELREQRRADTLERPKAEVPVPVEDDSIAPEIEKNLDPGIKKRLAKIKELEAKSARIDEIEAREKERDKRELAREHRVIDGALDDAFATLADKRLGAGTIQECTPAEQKRRSAVLSAAGVDVRNLPSAKVLAKKLKEAVEELLGASEPEKPTEASAYDALQKGETPKGSKRHSKEEWNDSALEKPTKRESPELPVKGEKAAIAGVARWQKQFGTAGEDIEDPAQLNGVPD